MSDEQTQATDDPSGPGWRDLGPDEILQTGDMVQRHHRWSRTRAAGRPAGAQRYRRRIEQQQPSDSEPETMEQLRKQLATSQHLAEMSRRQVEDEAGKVERLKEQVQTLTRKLKDANDTYQICLQNHYKAGQRSAIDKLQAWLRPVLEVVSDHPDHTSILAVSVLEFLPQIASRLIEE